MNEIKKLSEQEIWKELSRSVVEMDEKKVEELAKTVLEKSFSVKDAILKGLADGMWKAGEEYERNVYFIPEILMCSDAMYAGYNILKKFVSEDEITKNVSVVIGVVEGDFHDIGKNIVSLMMQASGYRIFDLGANVPCEKFLEQIKMVNPDIVAMSTLMSTTLDEIEKITKVIRAEYPDGKPNIMIGGAPATQTFCENIGADFYGEDAMQAVSGVKQLMGI